VGPAVNVAPDRKRERHQRGGKVGRGGDEQRSPHAGLVDEETSEDATKGDPGQDKAVDSPKTRA